MFIKTSALPSQLQTFLKSLGFNKQDIRLEAKETVNPQSYGAEGHRAFFAMYNLSTHEHKVTYGSWGGPNAYTANVIDELDRDYTIPPNTICVRGSEGGGRPTYATLLAHPSTMAPLLPATVELSQSEKGILKAFAEYKSGPYRNEQLSRYTKEEIVQCVQKGFLKESKNGAKQITTEGKNALGR